MSLANLGSLGSPLFANDLHFEGGKGWEQLFTAEEGRSCICLRWICVGPKG